MRISVLHDLRFKRRNFDHSDNYSANVFSYVVHVHYNTRVSDVEPVGSSVPKFPSIERGKIFSFVVKENLVLLCPAQGYPIPSSR